MGHKAVAKKVYKNRPTLIAFSTEFKLHFTPFDLNPQ